MKNESHFLKKAAFCLNYYLCPRNNIHQVDEVRITKFEFFVVKTIFEHSIFFLICKLYFPLNSYVKNLKTTTMICNSKKEKYAIIMGRNCEMR